MTCEWRSKLDRYVDSELPAAELAQMDAHVRLCPSCAAEALSRVQTKRAIHTAAAASFTPRPEFRWKIQQMAVAGKPKRRWAWLPQFAVATAAVALILSAAVFWPRGTTRQDTLGELTDLHVTALASPSPVDVPSSDRHTVKPWFEGKLPFTFNLPELQTTPFRLVGGKLTFFEQNPGAQLLFGVRKHQISVFIFQDRGELAKLGSSPTTKLAFTIETWAEGGLRYFVISDTSAADVHALSDMLKAAARSH